MKFNTTSLSPWHEVQHKVQVHHQKKEYVTTSSTLLTEAAVEVRTRATHVTAATVPHAQSPRGSNPPT